MEPQQPASADDVSMACHLEARSILKLRDLLLASPPLPPRDAALALSLVAQQLHAPGKAAEAVSGSLTEICLQLLLEDADALVRERAARVLGGLAAHSLEGSARLAALTREGSGALALAGACAGDAALGVQRACAAALRCFAECGGREAPRVLAGAPAALEHLAQGVARGGAGEEGVRALAAACAVEGGAAAALGCPSVVPALVDFLAEAVAEAAAAAPAPARRHAPLPPHAEPPPLPALAALRDLCVLDAGKAAALAAGAPGPVAAALAHASPLVASAAACALAIMAQHLPALQAFLDGPPGCADGPGALAAALLPLLLAPATRMAARPAVQTACSSARGRAAVLAWALGEGPEAVRALVRCCPSPANARDLLAALASPASDGTLRAAALAGLGEADAATLRTVAFAAETLAGCPEAAAAELLARLREGGR
jgi:hypothetical protein